MKITVLMENVAGAEGVCAEHGLSLFIESGERRILMDTGQSSLTWENARRLGIDAGSADMIVISHGHYDHAGGLMSLVERGCAAPIYMQKGAGADFYSGSKYDGIDKAILELPQLRMIDGDLQVEEGVSIFSGIKGRRLWPSGNYSLKVKVDGELLQDDFRHEQCLLVEEEGKLYLFSGCAHNGILNILDTCRQFAGRAPDYVFSGFHMMQGRPYTEQEIEDISQTARLLMEEDTVYYTGHCTSIPAFGLLKGIMGEQLQYMSAGSVIEL